MNLRIKKWIKTAMRRDIVMTSIRVAVVVGTILVAINCGDRICTLSLTTKDVLKIFPTYMVPYLVSTYSSVKVIIKDGKKSL